MFTNGNTKSLSTRVEIGVYQAIEEVADATLEDKSDIVRRAVYSYLKAVKSNENLKLEDTLERVLRNKDRYIKELNEAHYRSLENKGVSNAFRKATFPKFMDDRLADIFMYWDGRKGQDEIEKILRNFLKSFEDRAEFEGFIEEWKNRKEEPIVYAQERLEERQLHEEKGLND